MRVLIYTIILFAVPAIAEMPEYLKDGVVTVTLANGEVYTFSSNEYAVVKREQPKLDAIIVGDEMSTSVPFTGNARKKSHTVIAHVGVGRSGLQTRYDSGTYLVSERETMVGGLTYCRNFDNTGLCVSGFDNSTFVLGIKADFE